MNNRPSSPLLVTVNVTGMCNLSCKYCYFQPRKEINMSLEDFEKTLLELKKNNIFLVTLSGGEPFLHPEINRMLHLVHKNFTHVSILSNGTAVTDDHLKTVKEISQEKGNFDIQISLDSINEEINDNTRGMTSSVLENIKKLKESGARITVATVITSENINNIIPTVTNLSKITKHFHVMPFRATPYLKGEDSYLSVPDEEIELFWKKLLDLKEELNLEISTPVDDICEMVETCAEGAPCMAGFTKLTIDPNLDVRPCDKCVGTVVGNLGNSSLKEVWDGKPLAEVYMSETIHCAI